MKTQSVAQAKWLYRIARSGLMKTYRFGEPARYSLLDGTTVPAPIAEILIRNAWVARTGPTLFGDHDVQTYEVLKP